MNTVRHQGSDADPRVYRAWLAAWAGDLDRAETLLRGLDDVAGLDLRARVHAQRGEPAEADRCWARVQELVPDDPDAAAGRRTLARIRAKRRPARPILTAGRTVVVASVLVCAALAAGAGLLASGGPVSPAEPVRPPEQPSRAQILQDRLDALDAANATAAARRARDLDAIAAGLAMPGVLVRRRAGDVQVLFASGLFPAETVISGPGAALLDGLGRRLAALRVRTTVIGHVVAVPGGPATGGAGIALARAQVAAEHLAAGGGLPLTAFALVSADQREGPFPDAPRNRTVTLSLGPAES
ncbi:tetratricopeptide repeat protein [Amycolatopsis samaneae]|uniref:Tetratricopeptide repeat protein n=1 Tax=Amycolatopsis samaneae TaxID=664691 RepID=A0ABW5G868_9PSEU